MPSRLMSPAISQLSRHWPKVSSFSLVLAVLIFLLPISIASASSDDESGQWRIREGDRVVFLGSTLIERENTFGVVEMSLRLAFPRTDFTTRNLGWSGDNVLGESRAYFGPVKQGYEHIQEYVKLTDPTVLLLAYGHNAAFKGEDHLETFLQGYGRLLDDVSAADRRLVVLGLTPLEPVVRSGEQVKQQNEVRQNYNRAIKKLCEDKGAVFVDLFEPMLERKRQWNIGKLTQNGVHLNREGYIVLGDVLADSAGQSLDRDGEPLLRDSQFAADAAPLYEEILWKNELFFHRFRPQNETYLRGFRKHEQGQNAKEILEFVPLIEKQDQVVQETADKLLPAWNKALD